MAVVTVVLGVSPGKCLRAGIPRISLARVKLVSHSSSLNTTTVVVSGRRASIPGMQ